LWKNELVGYSLNIMTKVTVELQLTQEKVLMFKLNIGENEKSAFSVTNNRHFCTLDGEFL